MTRIQVSQVTCRVCGSQSKQATLLSSNAIGPPDLDGRPFRYSMLRDTMSRWVQRCPECGYCAMYISRDHEYDLPVAPLAGHEGIWAAPTRLRTHCQSQTLTHAGSSWYQSSGLSAIEHSCRTDALRRWPIPSFASA